MEVGRWPHSGKPTAWRCMAGEDQAVEVRRRTDGAASDQAWTGHHRQPALLSGGASSPSTAVRGQQAQPCLGWRHEVGLDHRGVVICCCADRCVFAAGRGSGHECPHQLRPGASVAPNGAGAPKSPHRKPEICRSRTSIGRSRLRTAAGRSRYSL
jgi:hypothetical protein